MLAQCADGLCADGDGADAVCLGGREGGRGVRILRQLLCDGDRRLVQINMTSLQAQQLGLPHAGINRKLKKRM